MARRARHVDVAICTDENLLLQAEVLAASIAWHSADRRGIRLHVFYAGKPNASSRRLARFRRGGVTVHLHDAADSPWLAVPTQSRLPPASYIRLSLPELLPDVDRLVYLDVDITAVADVAPLLDADLRGKPLGGTVDLGVPALRLEEQKSGTTDAPRSITRLVTQTLRLAEPNGYINTGVLVMDLAQLRASGFAAACRALIDERGSGFHFADQDAINALMQGRIAPIHPGWNVFARDIIRSSPLPMLPGFSHIRREALKRPRLIHHLGPKPWNNGLAPAAYLWWRFADLSPAGPELRASHPKAIVPPFIDPPPWWAPLAGPVTDIRYWLRRASRLPGALRRRLR